MPELMTTEQAIAELEAKLPVEVEYLLETQAVRGRAKPDDSRERADRFTLTIGCWGQFEERSFQGDAPKLAAAVGAVIDRVRTWQSTGVMPAACERCQDSGRDPKDGGTCDCRIPF